MKRYIFIIVLILTNGFTEAKQVNVMLHLNKILQVDTMGQNIVEILPPLVYPYILQGKIKLWSGPDHKIRIEGDALKSLEYGSKTVFNNAHEMFLYENWNVSSKTISVVTLGIAFTNRNSKGEEISYGFVDYNDLMDVIGKLKVPVNANGNSNLTYEQLFAFRRFDYNFVQYGNKTMKSLDESMKLKRQTFSGKVFQSNIQRAPENKLVQYVVERPVYPVDQREENSSEILSAMSSYLSSHMEDFLNMGGEEISNGKQNYKVIVNKIIVKEEWSRQNAELSSFPLSVLIYVNDVPLKEISYSMVQDWDLYVNLFGFDDIIKEKKFVFQIVKINHQEIPADKSEVYLKGLKEYDWSKLTEYVKYF